MPKIVTIARCTSPVSRASAVLAYTQKVLVSAAVPTETIAVRKLPAEDLLLGRSYSAPIYQSKALIDEVEGIVIAVSVTLTPQRRSAAGGSSRTTVQYRLAHGSRLGRLSRCSV